MDFKEAKLKNGISASMMCADFLNLKEQLLLLEKSQAEYLHMDIMDGSFVPNIALGSDFVNVISKKTQIPIDVHLMVENPIDKLDYFALNEGSCISIHYESCKNVRETLKSIKSKGYNAGIAFSPDTSLQYFEDCSDIVDYVLIMGVNPGFAGQKLIGNTFDRISLMKKLISKKMKDIKIEVDGNVSVENAVIMKKSGADIFVLGTSALFIKNMSIDSAAKVFRDKVLN